MKIKNLLSGVVAIGALALGSQVQADVICTGCEFDDGADATGGGTHVGLYNPTTFDTGTFQHSDLGEVVGGLATFEDFYVFDIDPAGSGSISADFTAFASITGFAGELYHDGGSTGCVVGPPGSCSTITLGGFIDSDADAGDRTWEIIQNNLAAGRYIIRVTGTTNGNGTSNSNYTGQLAFLATVPEPGTLALFGLGILGMGLAARRRRA
jgi:hypothetical protein